MRPLIALLLVAAQDPGTAVSPGRIVVEEPTFTCVGLEWFIEGDTDLDSRVAVEFRAAGETTWRPAQPLLRVEPRAHPTYGTHPGNLHAGSVFNLHPGTEYEFRLTLADPDGGRAKETVKARTRAEADLSRLTVRRVTSMTTSAAAGEIVELPAGVFRGPIAFSGSGEAGRPAVVRGAPNGATVIEGGASAGGSHFVLEGITVRGGTTGISVAGARDVTVRGCRVEGWTRIGICAQGAETRRVVIEDNVVLGPTDYVRHGRDTAGKNYGISVHGEGNVIRHNRIARVYDAISLACADNRGLLTRSIDIHHNDIAECTDDGIETDDVRHNIRVFRNRVYDAFKSFSCQPVFGGPVYLLYNEIYNARSSPYKFHVNPSGMIVMHNTSICADEAWSGGEWSNAIVRNNLFIGMTAGYASRHERGDFDFNGWSGAAGAAAGAHDRKVSLAVFRAAPKPPRRTDDGGRGGLGAATDPGTIDLGLRAGAAVDAGQVLANINDGHKGKAPDLGCRESGAETPAYGPRR